MKNTPDFAALAALDAYNSALDPTSAVYDAVFGVSADPAAAAARAVRVAYVAATAAGLNAAARLALDYLETLGRQPTNHPITKAQDALHDAIVAAQGVPTIALS